MNPGLNPDEQRVEDLLLRSASLDLPGAGAKERALDAGLAALDSRRRTGRTILAAGGLSAMAAGATLWLSLHGTKLAERDVAPERIRTPATQTKPVVPAPLPACAKLVVARGDAPLLDDWEGNDSSVAPLDGRGGNWATYDDHTGKQTPPDKSPLFPMRIPGGRDGSNRALHMQGGKFKDWGVTFGAELANAACYDASAYAGIEFWAKGPGAIKVGFQMIDVQDEKYGGFCKLDKDCYNTHRKVVTLDKSWKHYAIRWEELHQLYKAGPDIAFDPHRVRMLEFGIGPEATPFDLWIDDVSFVKR
jgi:hypothetical protein